ncbi:MAG TPA: 16S rRNA (cytosine(967)-C(5))-methyltransferase RsmB [Burkholderiales bacterium]
MAEAFVTASEVLRRVIEGESLNTALAELRRTPPERTLFAAAQDLCYNALRGYGVLDVALERLLDKPLTDSRLRALLLAASAELAARPQSAHAVVHQAVEATAALGCRRAKGLVNAVLRNFQRRMAPLLLEIGRTEVGRYRHPQWWIDTLRNAYPHDWEAVLLHSNGHPPMTLRVNRRRVSVNAYIERLKQSGFPARALGAEAVLLEKPCRVDLLPGFHAGEVSVQDAGAQRAAHYLDVHDGMRVLDACAAPGGKTGHILELASCDVLAVDSDGTRASRIADNLRRLQLSAKLVVGDSADPSSFWEGVPFDRILLDAPCSASGVVRRHPDIRWQRRASDISKFARTQSRLLEALWRVLRPGGKLLYTTCSVFPEENRVQTAAFLDRHPDATLLPLAGVMRSGEDVEGDRSTAPCLAFPADGQLLTCAESDGFYYAVLEKKGDGFPGLSANGDC